MPLAPGYRISSYATRRQRGQAEADTAVLSGTGMPAQPCVICPVLK
jgi:hypothetical protein